MTNQSVSRTPTGDSDTPPPAFLGPTKNRKAEAVPALTGPATAVGLKIARTTLLQLWPCATRPALHLCAIPEIFDATTAAIWRVFRAGAT